MQSDLVALVDCPDYGEATVKKAVQEMFSRLGGLDKFVKPGGKVLIKPNLLKAEPPEKCCTTHPQLVCEIAKQVAALGAQVVIADSPGGAYNKTVLHNLYKKTGLEQAAKDAGVSLNEDCSEFTVPAKNAKQLSSLTFIAPVKEADVIINVAKLKTHTLTGYTGAVKNLYGTIPGFTKAEYHFRFKNSEDFCNALIDIEQNLKPELNIIDAVMAMEGEGPSSGQPRQMGLLIGSSNAHAADVVGVNLIGYQAQSILTTKFAVEGGLSPDIDRIKIVGEDLQKRRIPDFKKADFACASILKHRVPGFMRDWLERALALKPKFLYQKCVGCGICEKSCPPKAITMVDKKPQINEDKCINCFCCQELCPQRAVKVKKNFAFKLVKLLDH